MGFAKGFESTNAVEFKKYIGVGVVNILAVNPTAREMKSKLNRDAQVEPEYVSTSNINGSDVTNVRLSFYVSTLPELNNGIAMSSVITFFIRKAFLKSKEGKLKVIDKYGNTSWVTEAQFKAKEIPTQKNGKPAKITKDYRPMYNGEEAVVDFLKNYLCIPDSFNYNKESQEWILKKDNLEECEAELNCDKLFAGNFKELSDAIAFQPHNKVKVLFGVRTAPDGKSYQTTYNEFTLRANSKYYLKLAESLNNRKAAGAYSTTEFEVCDLKEYVVEATSFNQTSSSNDLFGGTSAPSTPTSTATDPFTAPSVTDDNDDLPF